jgi:pseudaminic acid biosynthesis-associated methylase
MDDTVELWSGEFGDKYTERNLLQENLKARGELWKKIIWPLTTRPKSVVEIGAGCGANLRALRGLCSSINRMVAVEPNASARRYLEDNGVTFPGDALDGTAAAIPLQDGSIDMAFTSGLLIHIPPKDLGTVMDEIYRVTRRWILAIEYFSPEVTEVKYRGVDGALWKADYGSLYLDRFQDLRCVSHGFEWKRTTGLDNVTWWLMEKIP